MRLTPCRFASRTTSARAGGGSGHQLAAITPSLEPASPSHQSNWELPIRLPICQSSQSRTANLPGPPESFMQPCRKDTMECHANFEGSAEVSFPFRVNGVRRAFWKRETISVEGACDGPWLEVTASGYNAQKTFLMKRLGSLYSAAVNQLPSIEIRLMPIAANSFQNNDIGGVYVKYSGPRESELLFVETDCRVSLCLRGYHGTFKTMEGSYGIESEGIGLRFEDEAFAEAPGALDSA